MVFKIVQRVCALLCCLSTTAALAFAETPYDSKESGFGPPTTPFAPMPSPKTTGPELRIEVSEEGITALVAAHKKVVKELTAVLDERDAFGVPTVRAHLAAKALIDLEHRNVLPFLAHNIGYRVPIEYYSGVQPVLQVYPYLVPLLNHEEAGAKAIVSTVSTRDQYTISELDWTLYCYVLVGVFGGDENGRKAAIAMIDRMDRARTRSSPTLRLLKERVRTAKEALYR
jgi:hypothetical protein